MSEPQTLERASERPPAHTPKYKRVTLQQAKTILELRKLGKTQTEIGQAVGLDHSTVSRWLATSVNTCDLASDYLAHNALRMAQSIVKNGKPREHVQALQGLKVLDGATIDNKIQVLVGVSLPGLPSQERTVTATLSPSLSEGLSPVSE